MTVDTKQQAPGCFGAASVFSMDSKFCQACVAFSDCSEAALKTLETIRATVNVSDILKRHQAARQKMLDSKQIVTLQPIDPSPIPVSQPKRITKPVERKTSVQRVTFTLSPMAQMLVDEIGKKSNKAKEQAIVLFKQNKVSEMLRLISRGENAFAETGPAYLRVICDMIINGGFTKASYKAQLMKELNWTDGTAASHVFIGVTLVCDFHMVIENAGHYSLKPELSVQNV